MRHSTLSLAAICLGGILVAAAIGQEAAKPLKLAEVSVSSAEPVTLDAEAKWSKIPDYVAGAKIYAQAPKGGDLEFTAKSAGLVIIAASWTYDGNESGGWYETRTTREQLVEHGWTTLDDLVWTEKDTHTLFFRQVKAGDKFKFHTRKYNQPFLIEADPAKIAAAADRFSQAAALAAKAKPAPAVAVTTPAPAPVPAPVPPPAKPADKPQRGEIQVAGTEQIALTSDELWSPLPDYLRGATVFQQASGNSIDLSATRDVQVVVAASWSYDGNQGGGWYPTRMTLPQLIAAGWEPIGTIVQKNRGEYTLLRRTLKAGEQVKFHTRKYNPPVAMLVAADKARALADAPRISAAKSAIAGIRAPTPRPAVVAGKGLVLRVHEPDRQDRFAQRGFVVRELVRQAVLLAAREELGLATRDDALRERGIGGGLSGPLPLDVMVHAQEGGLVHVIVFRFVNDKPDILWEKQLVPPGEDLILALTTAAEQLSRQELLDVLKKAGYNGRANKIIDKGITDAETAQLLTEMHPLAQFAAARRLHEALHTQGESPERLADLARAYANLSALTEHLWSPAHKAYKARALLYAERAARRWPNSSAVLASRAYARALVGLHQAALDDLAAAKALAGASGNGRSVESNLIESFCKFDLAKLDDPQLPKDRVPLARMLKLLAVERFSGTTTIVKSAEAALESVPDSDRAIDAIFDTNQLGTERQAIALADERTPQGLYRRLLRWDDLPRRAGALASQAGADDPAAERERRLELVRALRREGDLGADTGEPSWQAVASWIEEVAFLQSVRQMEFLENSLSVSLDESRQELEPLVADHPLQPFFASLRDAPEERGARFAELFRVLRPEEATENESFLWSWLDEHNLAQGQELRRLAFKHQDWIYRDLLHNIRNSRELAWAEYAGHLRRVAPHSPLTVASTIRYDWNYAAPRAADWEKLYLQSPQVQGALGKQYLKQEKLDDAIRCLTRQVALQPEFAAYLPLAAAWSQKDDEAKFLAVWDEYLQQDDYGLGHAQAGVQAAEYLMAAGKMQKAWPYAEAAAGSGAEWAMQCAVDCLTGLDRWPEAERYAQSSAGRYPDTAPTWYFWCRRTGKGAIAASRSYVREVIAERGPDMNVWYHGVFLTLEGEKEKALTLYRDWLAKEPNPILAWQAALLADELKQTDVRDQLLQMAQHTAIQPQFDMPHLGELARLAQEACADAAKLPAMTAYVKDNVRKVNNPRQRCSAAYMSGKFLLLHGEKEAGADMLAMATRVPFGSPTGTLAVVELREQKADEKKP